ncbi:hypothetical protein QMA56_05070 [Leuconostoc falkenbergense]|uniref:hypothetical protein n=1 Tax=Leuconostoc falkenbergense TaxID=2766470 RepID=UPI0024ACDCDE|nr:hypothetical protein [Leuconostoc falkenbergense]MDI6667080.1 hypothetical protein [Leuconostoc falkenbergense]
MTETVVHVTTLEQWKSVLDVWFEQGYIWVSGERKYSENLIKSFEYLILDDYIYCSDTEVGKPIEYSDFMAQQKEDNKMAMVYEVSQSVFDELQRIKAHEGTSLIGAITLNAKLIKSIEVGNKAILRYLADDPEIEFKAVKEQLYRLWRIDTDGDRVYMKFSYGTPAYVSNKDFAFTASLEEITKWNNPAWEIEKVDD